MSPALKVLTSAAVVAVTYPLLFPKVGRGESTENAIARNEVSNVRWALVAYKQEYGDFPEGNPRRVIKRLSGFNPGRVVFVELRPKSFDSAGYWIDPWRSQYRIDLSDPNNPRIHSPGRNKIDEPLAQNSDDVRSWF